MRSIQSNTLKFLFTSLAPLCLLHCGQNPAAISSGDNGVVAPGNSGNAKYASVRSTVVLGKVGVLEKASAINLTRLVVTAISGSTPADTVCDTSIVSGNSAVTVTRTLTLKPLRNWTVMAKSLDALDSVIHSGTAAPFFVKPADTAAVSLNLSSRYAMYQANFNGLPDSISSTLPGTGKDKLNLNRLVLKVDGVVKCDSALASGYFTAGQSISEYFDYITPGTHTVTLEAHGALHTYAGILYTGSSTFTVAAGFDDTRSITLNWVGPTTGTGKLTVILGKIGKVVINGGISGAVL